MSILADVTDSNTIPRPYGFGINEVSRAKKEMRIGLREATLITLILNVIKVVRIEVC